MNAPLMPKATAVWLIANTSLTFDQIADFCRLHPLEVQGIADGDVAIGIMGEDPIINGQLTRGEIRRCEQDPEAKLELLQMSEVLKSIKRKKEPKYVPVARRGDKPDAILWLLKNHPNVTDAQVIKLLGTTKATVASLRNRKHWDIANIKPRDPVLLGICSQVDLDHLVQTLELAKVKKEEDI